MSYSFSVFNAPLPAIIAASSSFSTTISYIFRCVSLYPEGGDFFGFLLSVAHWRSIVWVRVLCFVGLKSERGLDTTANLLHLALRTFPNVVSNPLYPLPSPQCASFFKFLLAARPIRVKSPALVASLPYTFISLSSMLYP